MTQTPGVPEGHPQRSVAPPAVVPESGQDRMIRGLKTLGVGALLVVAGLALAVWMGSQGMTGKAAFAAAALVLVGAFMAIKGAVLAIWGGIAKGRDPAA